MTSIIHINQNYLGYRLMKKEDNTPKKEPADFEASSLKPAQEPRPSFAEHFDSDDTPSNRQAIQKYGERLEGLDLPFTINSLLKTRISRYLNGRTMAGPCASVFLGDTGNFFERMHLRKDSKEFCQNYSSEIKLISRASTAFYDYVNSNDDDNDSKEALDETLLEAVREYVESPNNIKERFTD